MKVVILAGGLGTRISEETETRPKPLVEIGGKPILWHIMKTYSYYGFNDFVICLGFKGYMIKEYFANYYMHMSDVTFDIKNNHMQSHRNDVEPWNVTLIDTGTETQTGGRLKRAQPFIGAEDFCFTYGDGVSDINIQKLVDFHKKQGVLATVTTVQPRGKYGLLGLKGVNVTSFKEKPPDDSTWINAGFFVLSPKIFDYIDSDDTIWEQGPMETLVKESNMTAYTHKGFWKSMDTLKDKHDLGEIWATGKAPWKVW